jgi:WD40 repeat protein
MAAFCAHAMTAGRKEASRYVRRHAVKHFLEVEDWDNATLALTDLEFIEARAIAQELPEILYDYALARDLLPEREHSRKKAEELRSANDRFTRELIAYSDTWSRIREGSSEVMPQLPRPVGVAPLITSDQIVAERIRIHDFPNRLDCVTDFWKFCATHIKYLSKNSCQQGYVSSTAYNFSPAGPVHAAGARFMQKSEDIKIQRNTDQEYYNPLDPFCGDLEMLQRSPCLAMTPNGKRAVAGDSFHRLWVWDLEKRYCIKILGEEKEYFYSSSRNHAVAMTPCGSRVVSVGWNQELRVWDIESGECIKELVSGKGTVFALAITPCGRRVVSCTGCDRKEETFFQVWDIESGCCVKEVFLYSTTYAVAVSPCGTNALVGSCPGFNYAITKINLDLTEDGYECYEQMKEFALVNKDIKGSNHRGHVRSMAMTPCGTRLISGSEDSKVRVWDLVNGKCLNILEGHESGVTSVAVTPCGRRAISGDLSGTLRVWDLKSGECLKIIVGPDQIYCLALTACGSLAISGHSRGMRIWDVTVGDRINDHMNGSSNISHMALAPNGKHVATQQAGNKIKLWDAKTGRCSSLTELLDLPPCRGFAMSPCGERVIFGGYDRLGFLNLIGNPIIDIVKLLEDSVMSLNVTPCEKFIITLGLDQKLNIWDAKEFQLLEQKTQTFHEVSDLLAISPCGRFIVMGTSIKNSKDRLSLHLWDLESWKIINVFKGHKDSLNEIAFTPCGRFIIAASDDNTLHVWDACGGVTLFELKGHIGPCASIALTPCGKRVVSSCELEDAIRVWDLDTGEQLSIFKVDRPTKILIKSDIVAIAAGHEVFIARHQNLINGPLITTAIKMSFSHDCDSKLVNARTPCCANVISIPEAIADRIEQWTNENGDGSYTDPILLLDCPSCGTPLRMNPFFIDIKTGWLVHGASNLPADDMGAQKLLAPLQERFKTVWREITFEQWKSWADTSMTNSVDGTERPLIHPLVLRFLEYMNDKLDEEQFKNVFNVPNPRKFVSISKFIYTKDFIVETENKRLVGEIAALEVSYAKLTDGTAAKALGIAQLEDKKKELHKLLDVTYLKDIIVDAQATINSKWASLFKHYIIGLNSNINVIFDYDHDDQAKASIIRKLTYASKTNAGVSQGGTAHEVSLSMMRLEVIISSIMRQFIKNCGLGEYLTGELLLPHAHDNEEKYKEFDANIPVNFNKDVDNEFKYISRIYSILNTQIVEYSRDLGHITFSYLKNAMYNGVELFPLFLLAIENNCTQAQKNQLKDDRGKDIAFSDKQIKDSMAALRAKCREEIEDWINAQ